MQNPCFFCGGAAHPATGHAYSATVLACYNCTVEAFRFVVGHTNKKAARRQSKGGEFAATLSFYESAVLFPPQPR